jgi:anti-sigma B factor antagonist
MRLEEDARELEVLIRSSDDRGATLVELVGEFDLYTGSRFERVVLAAMGRGATDIVVDLSGVTFIDSTTIGVLMRTRQRLAALRGRLLLVCRDQNILRLLRVTTLDRLFEVYASSEEAFAALNGAK